MSAAGQTANHKTYAQSELASPSSGNIISTAELIVNNVARYIKRKHHSPPMPIALVQRPKRSLLPKTVIEVKINDAPLGGVQPVVSNSSHGASSDASNDSIYEILLCVNNVLVSSPAGGCGHPPLHSILSTLTHRFICIIISEEAGSLVVAREPLR